MSQDKPHPDTPAGAAVLNTIMHNTYIYPSGNIMIFSVQSSTRYHHPAPNARGRGQQEGAPPRCARLLQVMDRGEDPPRIPSRRESKGECRFTVS
jgi:hypothetical protein